MLPQEILDGKCDACKWFCKTPPSCSYHAYDDHNTRTFLQLQRDGTTKLRYGEFGCHEFELARGKKRSPRPVLVNGKMRYKCGSCGEAVNGKYQKCPLCKKEMVLNER